MTERNTTFHKATIKVAANELDRWEDLLARENIDYEEEGWNDLSCVWTRTARFRDGMEVDVKVCTVTEEDGTCWSEAVLFDRSGSEISHTEVCDSLRGEWEFEVPDAETGSTCFYVVDVREI